jgi:hypothetical protein
MSDYCRDDATGKRLDGGRLAVVVPSSGLPLSSARARLRPRTWSGCGLRVAGRHVTVDGACRAACYAGTNRLANLAPQRGAPSSSRFFGVMVAGMACVHVR